MTWRKFSIHFKKAAKAYRYTEDDIKLSLKYAKKLFDQDLPVIYDQVHFGSLTGYTSKYIYAACNFTEQFYRAFTILKQDGSSRQIHEPLPSLKEIQQWILREILIKLKVSNYAKAFILGTNIKANARFHRNQKYVLSLDIEDFFGSIKYNSIYRIFRKVGYSKEVSGLLGHLCTLNDKLPQGAPTSPTLSNLIFYRTDLRIGGFCLKSGIRYTRYADDMTFSGDFDSGTIIKFVNKILQEEGLRLNKNKTRLMGQHQRQEVTGIVTNQKMQAPREIRKKFRQNIYYIEKYGIGSHLEKIEEMRAHYIEHLLGISNFISFINPEDNDAIRGKEVLKKYLSATNQ